MAEHGALSGTIRDLVDLAFVLVKGKHKLHIEQQDYSCNVSKSQVQWSVRQALPLRFSMNSETAVQAAPHMANGKGDAG